MAFSAGAITGTLGLDASQFAEAIRESSSLAGEFGVELGRVLAEATGSPMLGELANGFSEIAASLGEGHWSEAFAAGIHVAGAAASGFIELVKSQAEAMHNMGLAAERAGVSVEWFSSFSKAAADSGVNADELGATLKYLQRNAADAVDGNKEMAAHFSELGLSVDYLRQHLDDVQGLFASTLHGLGGLGTEADKVRVSWDLLGRGGASLKPIFEDGGAATMKLAEQIRSMGGAFDESDVKLGDSFSQLSTIFDAAMDGLEKSAARPVLEALQNNSSELLDDMQRLGKVFSADLPGALKVTEQAAELVLDVLEQINRFDDAAGDMIGSVSEKPRWGNADYTNDAWFKDVMGTNRPHWTGPKPGPGDVGGASGSWSPAAPQIHIHIEGGADPSKVAQAAAKGTAAALTKYNSKVQSQVQDQAMRNVAGQMKN
jgi:hypothetical protein